MAACCCRVASTKLAGGLRPELRGQVPTLQKPQAPCANSLAAAVQELKCTLSSAGETLGENLGMEGRRKRGQVYCAGGQAPVVPFIQDMASIDNNLTPARQVGPMGLVLPLQECVVG